MQFPPPSGYYRGTATYYLNHRIPPNRNNTTMPRLNESGDATISVKCKGELVERADTATEKGDCGSRSELIRQAIEEKADRILGAETEESEFTERQERAIALLNQHTGPRGKLPSEEAKSIISENMGIKKTQVKRAVFEPLEEAGAIEPNWGSIRLTHE